MASIIQLHAGRHDEIRALLPWFVTGRLDTAEHAQGRRPPERPAAECQADLEFERRLEVEVAIAPIDVETWLGFDAASDRVGRRGLALAAASS